MFVVAFSGLMIGVSLVYMTGFIQGGFAGIWFAILIFAASRYLLVDRQKVDTEKIQRDYRKQLRNTRPRKKNKHVL
jgi:hypothetical protein